jgi:hypothetical protein
MRWWPISASCFKGEGGREGGREEGEEGRKARERKDRRERKEGQRREGSERKGGRPEKGRVVEEAAQETFVKGVDRETITERWEGNRISKTG